MLLDLFLSLEMQVVTLTKLYSVLESSFILLK
jgi:hypothetical protein